MQKFIFRKRLLKLLELRDQPDLLLQVVVTLPRVKEENELSQELKYHKILNTIPQSITSNVLRMKQFLIGAIEYCGKSSAKSPINFDTE